MDVQQRRGYYKKGRSMDLAYIFMRYFFETEYMHFGYWEEGVVPKPLNLKRAQELYAEKLLAMIPEGVESILEVGCGSGEMAKRLLDMGYKVEIVSPPNVMTDFAQEKLGDRAKLNESKFEDFVTEKRYDLILFSESFQFVETEPGLNKAADYGKYILISDVFKNEKEGKSPIGGGHGYWHFKELLARKGIIEIEDRDVSRQISPQFDMEADITENFIKPLLKVLRRIDANNSFVARTFVRILLFFNRKNLAKQEEKHLKGKIRHGESFRKYKFYRFVLLKSSS